MKKVLFVGSSITNIDKQLSAHLEFFKKNYYTVHLLGQDTGIDVPFVDQVIDFDFFSDTGFLKEQKMIRQINKLYREENYTVVISFEEIPGYFARMAGRSSFKKFDRPKIFHLSSEYPFYENSDGSLEKKSFERQKKAGKTTDLLIVSNATDFNLAEKYGFSQDAIVKLYGIGVPSIKSRVLEIDKEKIRDRYQLTQNHIVALYDNIFEQDKNHKFLIQNIAPIIEHFPHFKLIFNGTGSTLEAMKQLVEKEGIYKNTLFLEKEDATELYAISDIYLSPSLIEGVPRGIVHALECSIPVLASATKGHVDLIESEVNGLLYTPDDYGDFIAKLYVLLNNESLQQRLISNNDDESLLSYFEENAQKHIFHYYRKAIAGIDSEEKDDSKNFNEA